MMVDVVNKLPAITILIFEVIENDSIENMSQIMNVVGKCSLMVTVNQSKLNPSMF